MMQSLYSAKMGIRSQQLKVDTIANNIANINTIGFKRSDVSFKDALYSTMRSPVQTEESKNLQQGRGVLVSSVNRLFTQGIPRETGVPLDMRIEGDGFFTLEAKDGQQHYTRNGAFAVSQEEDTQYLVNSQGSYVLDTGSNRIELPSDAGEVAVNSVGEMFSEGTLLGQLNIVTFINKDGLSSVGGGSFAQTEASGDPFTNDEAIVHQGSLENSNVDLAYEMTKLIRAQRAMTLVSKALTTSDSMSEMANNMR